MKTIAFIDNFIETPINHGFNEIVLRNNVPSTYHQPARFGMDSLYMLERADAFVLFGSASHVTEPEPWHRELLDYLVPKLESRTPVLGICFGHQLMAHHYGCEVGYIDQEQTYYQLVRKIQFNQKVWGKNFGDAFPMPYSHKQAVKKISDQLEVFCSYEGLPFEGLKHKQLPLWTVQGHPEASLDYLKNTLNVNGERERTETKKAGSEFIDAFIKGIK